jgi:tetratricopeptide (TPR) repeat protein
MWLLGTQAGWAEEKKASVPDQQLCERMIRSGQEAYARGRYLDAKEFFRKAVQADPESQTAWQYYDLSTVFALAEKVEQNSDMVAPGKSIRQEAASTGGQSAPPPPPVEKPKEKPKFKIVDDEGC